VVVLWVFDPSTAGFYPPCVFRKLTGWQCAGCGVTRALHAVLHGDFARAWALNPVAMVVLPVAGVLLLWRPSLPRALVLPAALLTVVLAVVWTVVRNL
jgi:hypothetical protein